MRLSTSSAWRSKLHAGTEIVFAVHRLPQVRVSGLGYFLARFYPRSLRRGGLGTWGPLRFLEDKERQPRVLLELDGQVMRT
jgi:hypothetical protein